MQTIGLTGGIGSGKTTVLNVFASLGVPCFVADEVAKSYYRDPQFLQDIAGQFGSHVLNQDGTLCRQALAQVVFSNPEKLQQLNGIIHPRVAEDFHRWCEANASHDILLLESAILYESGFDVLVDKVVEVYLDKEERVRRTMDRDHTSRELILARMDNQLSDEEKLFRADYVILNYEGNPRLRQVQHVLASLNSISNN